MILLVGILLVENQLLSVGEFHNVLGADPEVDDLPDPDGARVVALATEPDFLRPYGGVRLGPDFHLDLARGCLDLPGRGAQRYPLSDHGLDRAREHVRLADEV